MKLNQFPKKFWYLILATILFKIIIANTIELGNDEVYYYTYALQPDYNHFDHPPIIGFLIKLFTFNLHWLSNLSMRLGAIICSAIASCFIYLLGKKIATENVAWLATLVYNFSIYTGIIAGLFILPDSPQMPFYTASLYIITIILFDEKEQSLKHWLLLGLMIGLACLCKIHALFLWLGFGVFILLFKRKYLLNYRLYFSFIITAICFIPIIYWNIRNNFITYKFHSERVTNHSIKLDSFLQEIVGEIVYQNPFIFILIIASIIFIIRKKLLHKNPINTWLFCMSLPMILLLWCIALFNNTLPHWSGPAYIPLYFIVAIFIASSTKKINNNLLNFSGIIIAVLIVVASIVANFAPTNFGSKNYENFGEYCPTLDISGWNDFGKKMDSLVKADVAKNIMPSNAPILINKWFPAGHILFYVARQTNQSIIACGKLEEVHKFAWLNSNQNPLQLGVSAYCIIPSNINTNNQIDDYKNYFESIDKPIIIHQIRGGKMVRYFSVYRLKKMIKIYPNFQLNNTSKF